MRPLIDRILILVLSLSIVGCVPFTEASIKLVRVNNGHETLSQVKNIIKGLGYERSKMYSVEEGKNVSRIDKAGSIFIGFESPSSKRIHVYVELAIAKNELMVTLTEPSNHFSQNAKQRYMLLLDGLELSFGKDRIVAEDITNK